MRYLVLPFVLALGIIELILRVTALCLLLVFTVILGWMWLEDERSGINTMVLNAH